MKLLNNKTNVITTNPEYPFGQLKADTGSNDGVNYDPDTNNDYFQFFEKLFAESGITANDLLDNDTNGYQLFQALVKVINQNPSSGVIETEAQAVIKTKVIEIGDWDMASNVTKTVSHGLSDHTKIRSVSIIINVDDGRIWYPWNTANNGSASAQSVDVGINDFGDGIDSNNVNLVRVTGGAYDSSLFDSTSFNRGWVTIVYEV